MNRRELLGRSVIGAIAYATLANVGSATSQTPESANDPFDGAPHRAYRQIQLNPIIDWKFEDIDIPYFIESYAAAYPTRQAAKDAFSRVSALVASSTTNATERFYDLSYERFEPVNESERILNFELVSSFFGYLDDPTMIATNIYVIQDGTMIYVDWTHTEYLDDMQADIYGLLAAMMPHSRIAGMPVGLEADVVTEEYMMERLPTPEDFTEVALSAEVIDEWYEHRQ